MAKQDIEFSVPLHAASDNAASQWVRVPHDRSGSGPAVAATSQVPLWRVRFSSDTLYGADFVKGVPCGAYRYFSTSVSLFDLGNPFPRPDPHGMSGRRAQKRSRMARSATRKGFVLDGFEHDGTLVVVGMTKSEGSPRVVHEHSCHILVFGG